MMTEAVRLMLFPALMAFAACSDLLTMTISNRISLILIGGFFLLALATGMDPHAVLSHVAAALAVLSATFVMFSLGWIGGGDAKLAAATALWLGFDQLFPYLIYASLIGGVLTLAILHFRLNDIHPWFFRYDWIERLHNKGAGVPYGIALAIAALLVYPDTAWMKFAGG